MWFSSSFIVVWTIKALFIPLNLLSLYFLLRGHHLPGGGFIGGLTSALSFLLIGLTQNFSLFSQKWRIPFRYLAKFGMLLALISCSIPLLDQKHFLDHLWFKNHILGFEFSWGTALLFDLGVMLLVIGVTVSFILELEWKEAETPSPQNPKKEKVLQNHSRKI